MSGAILVYIPQCGHSNSISSHISLLPWLLLLGSVRPQPRKLTCECYPLRGRIGVGVLYQLRDRALTAYGLGCRAQGFGVSGFQVQEGFGL